MNEQYWKDRVAEVMRGVLDELGALGDVETVLVGGVLIDAIRQQTKAVAAARRASVRRLRQTLTLVQVGDLTGLTYGRIRQIQDGD